MSAASLQLTARLCLLLRLVRCLLVVVVDSGVLLLLRLVLLVLPGSIRLLLWLLGLLCVRRRCLLMPLGRQLCVCWGPAIQCAVNHKVHACHWLMIWEGYTMEGGIGS